MAVQQHPSPAKPAIVLKPDALKQITKQAEAALLGEALEADRKADEQKQALKEAFMSREVRTDAVDRVNAAVQRAAEGRKHEVELFRFPASFCNDGGRKINNDDPNWPDSLEGFAKRAYDAYLEHYKPLGYRMKAQVMDFPNGMMGDVALILSW